MGTKNNPGSYDCYAAAEPDEPMFILLARDPSAPLMVRQWAHHRAMEINAGNKPEEDHAKVKEALACAKAMEEWATDRKKT